MRLTRRAGDTWTWGWQTSKAQKRQLEDQLHATRREAENTHRDLKATLQELEDARQTLKTSEVRSPYRQA